MVDTETTKSWFKGHKPLITIKDLDAQDQFFPFRQFKKRKEVSIQVGEPDIGPAVSHSNNKAC